MCWATVDWSRFPPKYGQLHGHLYTLRPDLHDDPARKKGVRVNPAIRGAENWTLPGTGSIGWARRPYVSVELASVEQFAHRGTKALQP